MTRKTTPMSPVSSASAPLKPDRNGSDVENSFDVSAVEYEAWAVLHNAETWGAEWPLEPPAPQVN